MMSLSPPIPWSLIRPRRQVDGDIHGHVSRRNGQGHALGEDGDDKLYGRTDDADELVEVVELSLDAITRGSMIIDACGPSRFDFFHGGSLTLFGVTRLAPGDFAEA
ncbi:hypothetical protein [Geminicoccus flavidas]|uniref:hypothetical protein n=1 Tax=Geminicoccus flavidas TaxID=2506407 RepID=UPI001359659A|nr:hypothetical protein [Geminicoccus flavidas]